MHRDDFYNNLQISIINNNYKLGLTIIEPVQFTIVYFTALVYLDDKVINAQDFFST